MKLIYKREVSIALIIVMAFSMIYMSAYTTTALTTRSYTVTFDTHGGTLVSPILVIEGLPIPQPENPNRYGYIFLGWDPGIPEIMPAKNLTFHAIWYSIIPVLTSKIVFNTNGGNTIPPIIGCIGEAVTRPNNPIRPGWIFTGWLPAIPTTFLLSDITCVAQWAESISSTFNYSNQKYEPDLAIMGAKLMSAYDDKLPKYERTEIIIQTEYKFEKVALIPSVPGDTDGIGFLLAHKIINGNEHLITVAIQGTVDAQWQGDMDITGQTYNSASENHYSFMVAKKTVKDILLTYIAGNHYDGKITLFIIGHSRGAAVANLLAKEMTDENYKVYGYTFATPNVSMDANATYKNIYNFCFTDDFVTRSPFSSWNYGKYGTTFLDTAQALYSDKSKPGFKIEMDKRGTYLFSKRAVDSFITYMSTLNPSRWYYYNNLLPDISLPYYPITTHFLLRNSIAPLLANDNLKLAQGVILSLKAFENDSCVPIITFFGVGANTYINSAHQPYTYYSALLNGGFKATKSTMNSAPMAIEKSGLLGSNVANPKEAELDQLRTFANQGDNLATLGWDLDDISTWTGITWNEETENRVQNIDLEYLNLTGTLDLSGFSGLTSMNCAGNLLTDINFGGCSALADINVSHNNLSQASLPDCTVLEILDCSWNQLTTLGITNCAALKYLYCEQNSLSTINVSNNTNLIELYCNNNNLTQLDVTANTVLKTLGCDNNYLDIQDGSTMMIEVQNMMTRDSAWVSYSPQKVPEAAVFNAGDIAKLTAFANIGTNLEKLGWDLASPKDWYFVEWVQLGSEYKLKELNITGLELTGNLNLSGMTELISLSCDENALTGLNLSGCTALQYLTCKNAQLQSLDITNCAAVTNLSCENNYLNVSAGTALRTCLDSLSVNDSDFIVYEPQMILADISAFNSVEYNVLTAFSQTDDNLTALSWDINKPGEWQGIKWASVNGEYRVTEIDFSSTAVTGTLDVSAFNLLTAIDCAGSGISSILLPATLTAIGNSAFSCCNNLSNIVIPNGVETIGDKAFYGCGNLASITFGERVYKVGFGAFAECGSLTDISLSGNNMNFSVINGVLFDLTGKSLIYYPAGSPATEYTIPDNVLSIEKGAFFGCQNLVSVVIGKGLNSLSSESFSQCNKLENVNIPEGVVNIESNAFSYCVGLKNIYIPGSVGNMEDNAFFGCVNLEKVITGNNLANIGEEAFAYYDDASLPLPNLTVYCYEGSAAEYYAEANGLNYLTYKISVNDNSTAYIDNENNFIYGLDPGINSLDGYVTAGGVCELTVEEGLPSFGTGRAVNVVVNGTFVKTYIIVLFGDVNGDGNINNADSDMIIDIGNYALPQWDPETDDAYIKAGDLFRDSVIDENDCVVLKDVQNYALTLDQRTGEAH